ncbi:MAG TPA: VanZ family protein [Woeseiaceae bacterium]|nr:VanZ family protein [Woeseiaceae bacterium]
MLPLRYVKRWRIAGVVLLAAAFVVALMPAMWPQIRVRDILDLDKALHGTAFTLLTVWFSGQYSRASYWKMAAGLLAFGAMIEVCQYMTNYRSAEWRDLYADAGGIVAGLAIALLGPGGWSLRFERWLQKRRG